jgi:hypothetical protein
LATRSSSAALPGIDTAVATRPPHANATTSSPVGSRSRKSSSETKSQNGTANRAKSKIAVNVAFGYAVKKRPAS